MPRAGKPVLQIVDPVLGVEAGDYLGWNSEGSWMVTNDGKVRVWNLQSNSLTLRYNTFNDLPKATLLTMKNSDYKSEYLAEQQNKQKPTTEPKPPPRLQKVTPVRSPIPPERQSGA